MKIELKYFKSEIYKIPRDQEAIYRGKYQDYQDKIKDYEFKARKIELELKGDEVGLLGLEQGIDTSKRTFKSGVNSETQALANHGFDLQEKSKASLLRSLNKVNETNTLANESVAMLK